MKNEFVWRMMEKPMIRFDAKAFCLSASVVSLFRIFEFQTIGRANDTHYPNTLLFNLHSLHCVMPSRKIEPMNRMVWDSGCVPSVFVCWLSIAKIAYAIRAATVLFQFNRSCLEAFSASMWIPCFRDRHINQYSFHKSTHFSITNFPFPGSW